MVLQEQRLVPRLLLLLRRRPPLLEQEGGSLGGQGCPGGRGSAAHLLLELQLLLEQLLLLQKELLLELLRLYDCHGVIGQGCGGQVLLPGAESKGGGRAER